MARSLVLNASYEPLSVVSERRALILVLTDRASLVVPKDEFWHSERVVVQIPSVVKLHRYVKVPYRRSAPVTRRAVFGRDGHQCQYCGGPAESLDHVTPRSRGGDHSWENVVACCRPCNVRKGDRTLHESGLRLRSKPGPPRRFAWIYASTGFQVDPNWQPFLLAESA
ncbi:MAG: HNH endonuclease [Actinobacteria bacterium]|nr:HNH endonuclease [Actinomycetota bacterium]MCI0545078.1 HNH endonuclease [Actinomycetota bacterium]MCI0677712.1 HNH endonuclease [Actinomycetota bacterium]